MEERPNWLILDTVTLDSFEMFSLINALMRAKLSGCPMNEIGELTAALSTLNGACYKLCMCSSDGKLSL